MRKIWIILPIIIVIAVIYIFSSFNKKDSVDFKNTNSSDQKIIGQNIMKIESEVFENNGEIPVKFTCYGESSFIPLLISEVPASAKSLALIVDDPDAPSGDFVHWVVWNIDPKTSLIKKDDIGGGMEGFTSLKKAGFVSPCPPSGTHRYYFRLYALDEMLSMSNSSTKIDLLNAMEGHILDSAVLLGLYGKD